jgi:WD40 repeat protein
MTRRLVIFLLGMGVLAAQGGPSARGPGPDPAKGPARQGSLPPAAVARLGSLRWFPGGSVSALAFLDKGRTLLTAGEGPLRAWQTATGEEVGAWPPGPDAAGFALAPGGRLLAVVGADHTLRVHDLLARRTMCEWPLGENPARAVAFAPDAKTVAWADASAQIHLHDVAANREARLLKGHVDAVCWLGFSPDGKTLASLSQQDGLLHWDLQAGKRRRRYGSPPVGTQALNASAGACFSADGAALFASSLDGNLYRYGLDSIEEQFTIPNETAIGALAASPGGRWLASGCYDGSVKLWDARTGKAVRTIAPAGGAPLQALAFGPGGQTLAGGLADGGVRLWDVASGKERLPREAPGPLALAAFSPDGREILTLAETRLTRWPAGGGKPLATTALTGGPVTAAALSPDGNLLALARTDRPVAILDARRGVPKAQTAQVFLMEGALRFTADSHRLFGVWSQQPNLIRLWSAETGKEEATFQSRHPDNLGCTLALSRDGRTLFTAGGTVAHSWEVASGQQRGALALPEVVQVNRNGRVLIVRGC